MRVAGLVLLVAGVAMAMAVLAQDSTLAYWAASLGDAYGTVLHEQLAAGRRLGLGTGAGLVAMGGVMLGLGSTVSRR